MPKQKIKFSFPEDYDEACRFFGCVEQLEYTLGVEFSLGKGVFASDYGVRTMEGRTREEVDALVDELDGEVDANCVKVKALNEPGLVRQGPFSVTFDFDEDGLEKGKERVSNIKIKLADRVIFR